MAIWQYDLFLVGEEDALPFLTDDSWELAQLPAASTLSAQRTLVGSLGFPWLMMDDWVVFGSEESTRVDLLFDGPDNVEIRIRLDASATDDAEFLAVCAFAGELRGRFFDPTTRTLIQPERNLVASALARSRTASFSNSPRSFLSGQSKS
jgi:hypothetical protein